VSKLTVTIGHTSLQTHTRSSYWHSTVSFIVYRFRNAKRRIMTCP